MVNSKNSKKGITLIALIITVIVLLILAGVTMSFVVGDNGVVTQAQKAKIRTDKESAEEEVKLEVAGSYDDEGNLDLELLNANLKNNLDGIKLKVKKDEVGESEEEYEYLELGKEHNGKNIEIESLPATVYYKQNEVTITGPRYLVDTVEIGDYVYMDEGTNYNTTYENNCSFSSSSQNSGYTTAIKSLTGWRVLSKSGNGATGTVQLISAGCPLTFYHSYGSSSTSIPLLAELYKDDIDKRTYESGFGGCGFEGAISGDKINLTNVFNNGFIDTSKGVHAFGCSTTYNGNNGTKTDKYQPLNEVETLYTAITGETKTMKELFSGSNKLATNTLKSNKKDTWNEKWNDMFCIGQSYWLGGSSCSSYNLWFVGDSGSVFGMEYRLLYWDPPRSFSKIWNQS